MSETRSALVIAGGVFADPGLADEARALADVLGDPDIGDFDVRTVLNKPGWAIRTAVAEFFDAGRPGDLLLMHYAGHAIRDDRGELYLTAADSVPDRLGATAVPAGFIRQRMSLSLARRVVLLLDCAYPGAVPGGLVAKGGPGMGIEREFRGPGRTVIAASGAPDYPAEAGGRGPRPPALTSILVRGLTTWEADLNRDGRIGLDELQDYVADEVRGLPGGRALVLERAGPQQALYIARRRPVSYGRSWWDLTRSPRPEEGTGRPARGRHPDAEAPDESAARGYGPPSGEAVPAEPPKLFWNTRFPRDRGILLHQPHLVVAGAEYLLQTALGPKPELGAQTSPQQAARLVDKVVRYRLEAENGEFRRPGSGEWDMKAESPPMTCTAGGTDAFGVYYRTSRAGPAIIRAFLIVSGGSVDQQRIELSAVSGEAAAGVDHAAAGGWPRAGAGQAPGRPAGRSLEGAPSPDFRFVIRKWFAELWHRDTQLADVRLPEELSIQLGHVAAGLYEDLREASLLTPLQADPDRPLRLADSGQAKLRLARAGAELHYRLFRAPIAPVQSGLPAELGAIADHLTGQGSEAEPLLLQIHAADFPLPWGLLYDRCDDGGRDLKTPDDVDPAGFWGRRFDIYRSVVSVDRDARRGLRRWVKPVVGADVPRNQEQRDFVDELRADLSDALLRVDGTSSTVDDLMEWATSGRDSDLVYLFCHAMPARYGGLKAGATWLDLGRTEGDGRVGLDQLEQWWGRPRQTNPIVILNACSSGQQNLVYGAPFVDFFMEKWGAQAFIGTDWPINASFADVFGRRLLREILQRRRSLRDAFRAVSDEAAADGNFFPLMYAIYGLSTVQFADPAPAPAPAPAAPAA